MIDITLAKIPSSRDDVDKYRSFWIGQESPRLSGEYFDLKRGHLNMISACCSMNSIV